MPRPWEKRLAVSELFFERLAEPGPRVLPVPVGGRPGEPQRLARFRDGDPTEQVQVRDPRRGGVFLPETAEQFVQRQDEVGILGEGTDLIEQFEPDPPATPLQPFPIPGMVDQDAAHGLGGGGEEVSPIVEVLLSGR